MVHEETLWFECQQPYIAGFLAFREVDALAALVERIRRTHPAVFPDVGPRPPQDARSAATLANARSTC